MESGENQRRVEKFERNDNAPILIVSAVRAVELNIDGTFVGDKATIESTYLSPLEALQGTEVTVSFPGSRYDGEWVLVDFSYTEVNAKQFTYSLRLVRGSSHIIL